MEWHTQLRGYYAVVDRDDPALAAALLDHARVVQLRIKSASLDTLAGVAAWLGPLSRERGSLFVINDHIELALACGADAVHLGQDDGSVAEARQAADARGQSLLVGVSTHTPAQVAAAVAAGADYLGFGPVFATGTKANPDPVVGLAGLAEAVRFAAPVPVVAIGGITALTAAQVARAGAHAACVIAAVNRAASPRAAAAAIAGVF